MQPPQDLRCSFALTAWERLRLAATMTFQRPLFLLFALAWPAMAVVLALLALTGSVPAGAPLWRMIAACLVFIPALLALSAAAGLLVRRGPQEPLNYVFGPAGIQVWTSSFQYTYPWNSIVRMKRVGGFLLFFYAPRQAHAIALRALPDARAEAALVAMAQAYGVGGMRG